MSAAHPHSCRGPQLSCSWRLVITPVLPAEGAGMRTYRGDPINFQTYMVKHLGDVLVLINY